jgi:hypothetical protein
MNNAMIQYEEQVARLREVARELQTNDLGRLMKFVKGRYTIGDDEVPVGTEVIAHIVQLASGWTKFKNNEVVDQHIGKPADGFRMLERDELGDLDEAGWERDSNGNARDPWVKQYYLPMEDAETGDISVFVTSSHGGRGAIGKLLNIFSRKTRNGLPIVKLNVASYKHRTFGRIETPDFPIVGWTGPAQAMTAALMPTSPNDPMLEPAGASNADLDDEIPF